MKLSRSDESIYRHSLLTFMVLIVGVITLAPFQFRVPDDFEIRLSSSISNAVLNVFLFVPIGFLYKLSRKGAPDWLNIRSLGLGLAISLLIELIQFFVAGRITSVPDLFCNGLGAWFGAGTLGFLSTRLVDTGRVKLPSLELPLMNLVYLLVPLIWLNGFSVGDEASRLGLIFLLVILGSSVIVVVYRNRLSSSDGLQSLKLTFVLLGWLLIVATPVLLRFPVQIALFGLFLALFVWMTFLFRSETTEEERRFELPTLRWFVPFFAIYLVLLVGWPSRLSLQEWHSSISVGERIELTFRFIEIIAGFTLMGYITAEIRGRRREPVIKTLAVILAISVLLLFLGEAVRGFPVTFGQILTEWVVVISGGFYGALIYRAQLKAILNLEEV